MYGVIARASCLTTTTKATSCLIPNIAKAVLPISTVVATPSQNVDPLPTSTARVTQSGSSLHQTCAKNSLFGVQQLRYAHTDLLTEPNFDEYQRKATMKKKSSESEYKAKQFTYVMGAATALPLAVGVKNLVIAFLGSIDLSKDVLAMAQSEVDLSVIPEGKTVIINWRSKPLFVRHRSADEIEKEANVSVSDLRDPEADHARTKKPEWVIVVGICTHLGCVPLPNSGKFGGFFCPCHGSHYDTSGRIRVGPAPLNLEVPPYEFISDDVCVVG